MTSSPFPFFQAAQADVANAYRRPGVEPVFLPGDSFVGLEGAAVYRLYATINDQLDFLTRHYSLTVPVRFSVVRTPRKTSGSGYLQKDRPCVVGPLPDGYTIVVPALLTDQMVEFFMCVAASPAIKHLGLTYEPIFGHPNYQDTHRVDPKKIDGAGRPLVIDAKTGIAASPEAFGCAMLLSDMAVRALVFHEFGHILHGHLLLKGQGGPAMMTEDVDRVDSVELVRAMEFDADAYACGMVFRTFMSWVGRSFVWPERTDAPLQYRGTYMIKDWRHAAILTIVAMYGIFRAAEDGRTVFRDLWKAKHPPAFLRAFIAAEQVRLELEQLGHHVGTEEFARDFIGPAVAVVEQGKRQMRPSHKPPIEELEDYPIAYGAYMARISPAWNAIRDQLDAMKLGGTIAPAHPTR